MDYSDTLRGVGLDRIINVIPDDVWRCVGSFLDIETRVSIKWPCESVHMYDVKLVTWQKHIDSLWGERYVANVHKYFFRYNPILRGTDTEFIISHSERNCWWSFCPHGVKWICSVETY